MASKKVEIDTEGRKDQGNKAARETLEASGKKKASIKQPVGIRVPIEVYQDLETLRAIAYTEKSGWSVNKELNAYLLEFVKQNRARIDEFRERTRTDDTEE